VNTQNLVSERYSHSAEGISLLGVPTQVIEVNENVRELAMTPSLRLTQQTNKSSYPKLPLNKTDMSSAISTKGLAGNMSSGLNNNLGISQLTNQ